jgi:hypothetical protein
MRKVDNSIGIIITSKLNIRPGTKYKVVRIDNSFVLTPVRDDPFAHPSDWDVFKQSVTEEDRHWNEMDNSAKYIPV